MVPSESEEPDPLKSHVSPLHVDMNEATGGWVTVAPILATKASRRPPPIVGWSAFTVGKSEE